MTIKSAGDETTTTYEMNEEDDVLRPPKSHKEENEYDKGGI